MSLRKYMHPKNKYKKVPDFKQLAILYPQFRKVAITDITGKVHIDFKSEETLRILTEVLLKHDFNLTVKIPESKLVPTLPLRLNYVLWIEDLMKYASFTEMDSVVGIDIGTGAVCIYPLLFATMYKCRMIGTEIDDTSVQTALANVQNNNLQSLIKIIAVKPPAILKDILEGDMQYHFVMSNPPFFENDEDDSPKTVKRLPPRNAHTGNEQELKVQGGERAFIAKMIEESIDINTKIKVYTTMLGQKSNLLFLIKLLRKKKIENRTWTEFCQGHTTRWGLTWTFLPKNILDLTTAPVIRKGGDFISKLIRDHPTEIVFPAQDELSSIEEIVTVLKKWTDELQMQMFDLKVQSEDCNQWGCKLIAEQDSWSHARRKRRLAQRQCPRVEQEIGTKCSSTTTIPEIKLQTYTQTENKDVKEQTDIKICFSTDKLICSNPFLVCSLLIELNNCEDDFEKNYFKICMIFERGSGGKNSLETLRQYLINKLNIREYIQRQCSESNQKKKKRIRKVKKGVHLVESETTSQVKDCKISKNEEAIESS